MHNIDEIVKRIEAILFVAGESVELKTISEALEVDETVLKVIIDEYAQKLVDDERGFKIVRLEDKYQMTTNEKYFEYVEKIYKKRTNPTLSESVLETLAIVFFKQPITKSDIASIRGVNSDYNVNKLLECNIIRELGRSDLPGRPILFGTTDEFLKYYGISSIEEFIENNRQSFDVVLDEEMEESEKIN